MDTFVKRRKTSITPALKRIIWDMHIGINYKTAICPICGLVELSNNLNSGFEAAHIVASKYCTDTLTPLYLFPSCTQCNNNCKDLCLLDYIYCLGRIDVLRRMIWSIFSQYQREHPEEPDNKAWKLMRYLYGPKRFPAGGGIVNERQIYDIAKNVQAQMLTEETAKLLKQVEENTVIIRALYEEKTVIEGVELV